MFSNVIVVERQDERRKKSVSTVENTGFCCIDKGGVVKVYNIFNIHNSENITEGVKSFEIIKSVTKINY